MISVVGTAAGLVAICFAPANSDAAESVRAAAFFQAQWTFTPQFAPSPHGRILALHFSRDGHFVLAQDHQGITILTVQPFAIARRIPVEDAKFVGFTPDPQEVVFMSPPDGSADSHVEHWRLSDGNQVGYFKIEIAGCVRVSLSPDGRVLLCGDQNDTLRAINIATQQTVLEDRKFERVGFGWHGDITNAEPGKEETYFSPDSRYVIVRGFTRSMAWDFRHMSEVPLSGELKDGVRDLAFIEPERVLVSRSGPVKHGVVTADLVEFPSGKIVAKPKIPRYTIFPTADPGFIIVRPDGRSLEHGAAAASLTTGEVIVSLYPALDVFGQFYVMESALGEVGLYEIGKGLQAKIKLR